jgi:transcriptional regulator with XRE-family HTH domain
MATNRAKRARERAGLTASQAAKLMNMETSDLLAIEENDSMFANADQAKLADYYGVNIPWLRGEVPLRDDTRLKDVKGWDDLSRHDQNVISEFAAALPKKVSKMLEDIAKARTKKP